MGLIEILISMHFFQESEDKSVTDFCEHKCLLKLIMLLCSKHSYFCLKKQPGVLPEWSTSSTLAPHLERSWQQENT